MRVGVDVSVWLYGYGRWANATAGHDKVIISAHAADGFDDLAFVVSYDFHALELDSEREAVSREESGVCVDGLEGVFISQPLHVHLDRFNLHNSPSRRVLHRR